MGRTQFLDNPMTPVHTESNIDRGAADDQATAWACPPLSAHHQHARRGGEYPAVLGVDDLHIRARTTAEQWKCLPRKPAGLTERSDPGCGRRDSVVANLPGAHFLDDPDSLQLHFRVHLARIGPPGGHVRQWIRWPRG